MKIGRFNRVLLYSFIIYYYDGRGFFNLEGVNCMDIFYF